MLEIRRRWSIKRLRCLDPECSTRPSTIDWYLELAATSLPDAETSRLDRYWMGNLEVALEAGTQKDSRVA